MQKLRLLKRYLRAGAQRKKFAAPLAEAYAA
jgi:hypothetical protein